MSLERNPTGHAIEVDAVPLDNFLNEISGAVAVKIDTQGAEPFVVAGGHRVLARAALVVLEFAPFHMNALGSDPNLVLEFLSGFQRIGIGSVNGDDLPTSRPAAEAVAWLRSKLAERRDREQKYWDVFAYRETAGETRE